MGTGVRQRALYIYWLGDLDPLFKLDKVLFPDL